MKQVYKLISTFALAAAVVGFLALTEYKQGSPLFLAEADKNNSTDDFVKYASKYRKDYKNQAEFKKRQRAFENNQKIIKAQDVSKQGYELELNEFADWTPEEYQSQLGFKPSSDNQIKQALQSQTSSTNTSNSSLSNSRTSLDWRTQNAVTPVKNQGSCGSCYAFASADALEGLYKIKKGRLVDFSAQQLVDCSSNSVYGNYGCNGGNMEYCFNYYKSNKAQPSSTYPYTATQQACNYNQTAGLVNTLGYKYVRQYDPAAIIAALKIQPLTVAVAAGSSAFQFYKSGILSSAACGTALNHAVLLVGYGQDSARIPFWIVKNSWGTSWGEQGYVRIRRDTVKGGKGICGIQQYIVYPTM